MATQTRFAEISFEEIEEIKDKGILETQNMPQNVALKVSNFQIYSNLTFIPT